MKEHTILSLGKCNSISQIQPWLGEKKPKEKVKKGKSLGGVLWGGCLDSSDSSLRIWPGHRSGFLSTSVQPGFHCLSPSEVFQPFPSCLPFTQPNNIQVQPENRQELAFRTSRALPVLKKLNWWGWALLPHPGATCCVTGLVWALVPGEDWELWTLIRD